MGTLPEFLPPGRVQERDCLTVLHWADLPLGCPSVGSLTFPPRSVLPFLADRHTRAVREGRDKYIWRNSIVAATWRFSGLVSWFSPSPSCRAGSIPTHHSGPSDSYWVSPAPQVRPLEFNFMGLVFLFSNFLQFSSGFSIGFVWQFSSCFLNSSLLSVKWVTWWFRFPIFTSRCSFSWQDKKFNF